MTILFIHEYMSSTTDLVMPTSLNVQQTPTLAAIKNYEHVRSTIMKTNYPSPSLIASGFLVVILISIVLYYIFMRPNISGIWFDIDAKKIYRIIHNKYTDSLLINGVASRLVDRNLYRPDDGVGGIVIGDVIQWVGGAQWIKTRRFS